MMRTKKGKKVKYSTGDRVVVNDTCLDESQVGAHGKVVQTREEAPDYYPVGKDYSVWLDGRPGNSPSFAESELDPEVP